MGCRIANAFSLGCWCVEDWRCLGMDSGLGRLDWHRRNAAGDRSLGPVLDVVVSRPRLIVASRPNSVLALHSGCVSRTQSHREPHVPSDSDHVS